MNDENQYRIIVRKDQNRKDGFSFFITSYTRGISGKYGKYKFLEPIGDENFIETDSDWMMPTEAALSIQGQRAIEFFQSMIEAVEEVCNYLPLVLNKTGEVGAMKNHIKDLSEIAKTLAAK
jgi:hypothetical protein